MSVYDGAHNLSHSEETRTPMNLPHSSQQPARSRFDRRITDPIRSIERMSPNISEQIRTKQPEET